MNVIDETDDELITVVERSDSGDVAAQLVWRTAIEERAPQRVAPVVNIDAIDSCVHVAEVKFASASEALVGLNKRDPAFQLDIGGGFRRAHSSSDKRTVAGTVRL
ncbi:hypothetical protein MI149_30240 [Mycolicibacterium crocinum]|uniref:Uncharacterized protein n=1 Tax=Mycolicibacterium crocinum TaxID=388459 RepID=A0ABY5TW67_9MYCO|nr:hypothetical protein [Mycolicibacterium crocinum]UVY96045.1 hypothetical protein MI149_30240 [Mycolicibacterium crocinum]